MTENRLPNALGGSRHILNNDNCLFQTDSPNHKGKTNNVKQIQLGM